MERLIVSMTPKIAQSIKVIVLGSLIHLNYALTELPTDLRSAVPDCQTRVVP